MSAISQVSPAGLGLIKEFESLSLKAYICPAGIPTIGWGHTGAGVKLGQSISSAEADALLKQDLSRFEKAVSRLVTIDLKQNQFDALVSLAFNIGEGAFSKSTLLKLLNAGDYSGASKQFERWNKGGGKVLRGLVRRRAAERRLFDK